MLALISNFKLRDYSQLGSAIYEGVGSVKDFLGRTLPCTLRSAAFCSDGTNTVITGQDSLRIINLYGWNSVHPAIYSATASAMITTSNSLAGAGRPISLTVICCSP